MKQPTDGTKSARERRTLKASEWPEADRLAWEAACKPSYRLKKGRISKSPGPGESGGYCDPIRSLLGLPQDQSGAADLNSLAAAHVTPKNVEAYTADLKDRVNSVTAWNCIYKVRRAAQLIAPGKDFSWLRRDRE